jgi:hypothetical protein
MSKQTALEYFYQRIYAIDITSVFEQAKEMEKQQIIDACEKFGNLNGVDMEDFKHYYNENYNK